MNTQHGKFLAIRLGGRTAGVFNPKVSPDPTVQKQLEDRVQAVLLKMQQQKSATNAPARNLQIPPETLRVITAWNSLRVSNY